MWSVSTLYNVDPESSGFEILLVNHMKAVILGYSFVRPTTSFLVTEFTHQKDASGIDQSLKLRLSFTVQGVAAFITIHVYNTVVLLQQYTGFASAGNTHHA